MSKLLSAANTPALEVLNIKLVKCTEPIMIKDLSKTEKDNNEYTSTNSILDSDGYPIGYDDVFNCVYPPEQWTENGKVWCRFASMKPAVRGEIIELEKEFKSQLQYWHAKEQPLCIIRRELFSQMFNEMIRQISIINVDRGVLLVRIRDEFKSTIHAYKQSFEDGFLFGTRKAAIAFQKNDKLENEVNRLKERNSLLKKELIDANYNHSNLKENLLEEFNNFKAANYHELEFFTKNHEILKEHLNIVHALGKNTQEK